MTPFFKKRGNKNRKKLRLNIITQKKENTKRLTYPQTPDMHVKLL